VRFEVYELKGSEALLPLVCYLTFVRFEVY